MSSELLLWKNFRSSAIAHLVLFLAILIVNFFSARPKAKLLPSIQVDLVGLPDLTKRELTERQAAEIAELEEKLRAPIKEDAPPPKPAPLKEVGKDVTKLAEKVISLKTFSNANPRKKELQSAIDRIRALEAMEEEVSKTEGKGKKETAKQLKGNAISKGNQVSGENAAANANEYASLVQAKLKSNWNLPVWLGRQKLSATAEMVLDRAGYVQNARIRRSSQNSQFDEYVLKTIQVSQPFGSPPSEWVGASIELGFPL